MVSSNSLSLVGLRFETVKDILTVVDKKDQDIEEKVEDITNRLFTVNVSKLEQDLSTAATSLRVAYAGTMRHESQQTVRKVLVNFQSIVSDSCSTCNRFFNSCQETLRNQGRALEYVSAKDPDYETAIDILQECAVVATNMEKESGVLAEKTQGIQDLLESACSQVGKEIQSDSDKNEEIKRQNFDEESKQRVRTVSKKENKDLIEAAKIIEKDARERAGVEQNNEFKIAVATNVLKFVTNLLPFNALSEMFKKLSEKSLSSNDPKDLIANIMENASNATNESKNSEKELNEKKVILAAEQGKVLQDDAKIESLTREIKELQKILDEKKSIVSSCEVMLKSFSDQSASRRGAHDAEAKEAAERANKIRKEQKELKEEDERSLVKIQALTQSGKVLEAALESLQLATTRLGAVQTMLTRTCKFWKEMATNSKELNKSFALIKKLGARNIQKEVIYSLENHMWNWLVFGKITWIAKNGLRMASEHTDYIASNLPISEEAEIIIKKELAKVRRELKESDQPQRKLILDKT